MMTEGNIWKYWRSFIHYKNAGFPHPALSQGERDKTRKPSSTEVALGKNIPLPLGEGGVREILALSTNTILATLTLTTFLCAIPFSAGAQSDEAELRLKLTEAMVLLQSEQTDKAFALIGDLKSKYPNNPQILVTEAEAYFHKGNQRLGLARLDEAARLAPDNEDIAARKRTTLLSHQPYVSVERTIEQTGDNTLEQFIRAQGEMRYRQNISLGAAVENDHIRSGFINRPNGNIENIKADKQRGEIAVGYDCENGNNTRGKLFLAEDTIGIGAEYNLTDNYGITTVEINLQHPEWDYLEGVVDEGVKDNIKLARSQRLATRLAGNLSASLNRYGLDDKQNIASSSSFEGGITYALPQYQLLNVLGSNSYFSLNYTFNAEYPFSVDTSTNNLGQRYEPLPVDSREIHSANLSLSKEVVTNLHFAGFGGYAIDRLGDDGPSFGASLVYHPHEQLEMELRASRSISTERSADELDIVGVNVKWVLGS